MNENKLLREALQKYVAWCEAENDHSGTTFYQRMDMCREAEAAARAALSHPAQSEGGEVVAWYEYAPNSDSWFLAYSKNPNAKTRPLVFGDTAPPASQEQAAFISPLMEQQMFDDWCPYKGNPDLRTVWAAAIEAVNGLLLGAASQDQADCEPFGYFRPEPFGWTDCAEDDEGAKPLYERPQVKRG